VKRIAIFASGTGSNAKKIVKYFKQNNDVSVEIVVSNRENAFVLQMAKLNSIETQVINRVYFYNSEQIVEDLKNRKIDLIVLAGFLWFVPNYLVKAFEGKIINIHPALLPKFGGKGMYGMNVHKAVKDARDTVSGMTVHYVNEQYDEGAIIFQASCDINIDDSPEQIAAKVLKLEHLHYAKVINQLLIE